MVSCFLPTDAATIAWANAQAVAMTPLQHLADRARVLPASPASPASPGRQGAKHSA